VKLACAKIPESGIFAAAIAVDNRRSGDVVHGLDLGREVPKKKERLFLFPSVRLLSLYRRSTDKDCGQFGSMLHIEWIT